jgi:DNA-binding transcriptional ArsR family regulator
MAAASPGFRKRGHFLVLTREARIALRGECHALAVYVALLDRVSGLEGATYPSYDTIAEDSGVSRRQVSTALAVLEAAGLLQRENRKGPNGRTSNLYELSSTPVRASPALTAGQDVPQPKGRTCPNPRAGDALEEEPVEEDRVEEGTTAAAPESTLFGNAPAPPSPRAKKTDVMDPLTASAHDLTTKAWDLRVKLDLPRPSLRRQGGSVFLALRNVVRDLLDAGEEPELVAMALVEHKSAWTINALQVTLGKLKDGDANHPEVVKALARRAGKNLQGVTDHMKDTYGL